MARNQLGNQQYNKLVQSKSVMDALSTLNITPLAQTLAFNPAKAPIDLIAKGLNTPTTQQSLQQTGDMLANAPVIKQVRQAANAAPIDLYGHKGSDLIGGLNQAIVQPTLKQAARFEDVTSGKTSYEDGVKGAAQYLSDVTTLGSLAYTGAKAGKLLAAPTLKTALPMAKGVAARQAASGTGQNIVYQMAEGKKLTEINPWEAALSGVAYAGLGTGLPLAKKLLKPGGKAVQAVAGQVANKTLKQTTPVVKAVSHEIDDSVAKIKPKMPGGLRPGMNLTRQGDVLDHPELYKRHPEIKNTDLNVDINPKYQARGETIPNGDGTFTIDLQVPNKKAIKPLLIHEDQHIVDTLNGKPYAGTGLGEATAFLKKSKVELKKRGAELAKRNENTFDLYNRQVGEVRARNAAARADWSKAQRKAKPFDSTLDTPKPMQLKFGGNEAMSTPKVALKQSEVDKLVAEVRKTNPGLDVSGLTPRQLRIAVENGRQQVTKNLKDEGTKMFGSRKDLAKLKTMGTKEVAELESEGERIAQKLVTKQRILGADVKYKPNLKGDPGVENYKNLLISSIPTRPQNTAESREAFAEFMPEFVKKVKSAKTIEEARQIASDSIGESQLEARVNFGTKFYNVVRGYSLAAQKAKYDPPTDFSWTAKKVVERKARSAETLHGGLEVPYVRTGDKVGEVTPERLRSTFKLKGVEYGNYVKDVQGQSHLQRYGEAIHDMEKATNTDLAQLIEKMKLGTAFGSRGAGGKAIAHYEPSTKVINITKKSGADGTLGHEFAHALDDFMGNASKGKAENRAIAVAMNDVMKSLKEGNATRVMKVPTDRKFASAWGQVDHITKGAKNADEAMAKLVERYPGTKGKSLESVVGYLGQKFKTDTVKVPTKDSAFFAASKERGAYWQRDEELFARAFASYLREKTAKAGISNNYLNPAKKGTAVWEPDNIKELIPKIDNLLSVMKRELGVGDAPFKKPGMLSTTLPKGYKLTKNGSVINTKTGKELTTGEVQKLTEPKALLDAENAVNTGKMKLSDTQAIENKVAKQDPLEALKAEAKKYKSADHFAIAGVHGKVASDSKRLILYKGKGGELDLGGATGMNYIKKAGESKIDMPKNTTSFTENPFRAREYGNIRAYSVPTKDVMPTSEYKKLLEKTTGGFSDRGLWRRADKYPNLIGDIQKAGYKGFKDTNGEVVLLDKKIATDLYNQVHNIKPKDQGIIYDTAPIPNKGKELSFDNPEEANFVKQYASTTKPKMAGEKKVGNQLESQIGKQYEAKGSVVDYVGFRKGMQDHGIDLTAANKDGSVDLVQAKVRGKYKSLHERPVQAFYAASEQAAKQYPGKQINRVLYTTSNVDKDAIKFAQSHGIKIVTQNIDGTGQKVLTQGRAAIKPTKVELTNSELARIQNTIPVSNRAEFLKDISNPNSGISKALGSVAPEKRLGMAEDWYKAVNPEGTYNLTNLKGLAGSLSKAKTVAEVRKVVADDLALNKSLKGKSLFDAPMMKRLQDDQFAQRVANTTNESEMRRLLNKEVGGGVYEPIQSNVTKLNKTLAKTGLTTGEGFQPGKPKYATRSLPETVKKSDAFDPEFTKQIDKMEYQIKPNKETLARVAAEVEADPLKALNEVKGLSLKNGVSIGKNKLPTDEEVAKTLLVTDKLTREGDWTTANEVFKKLSEQSSELGRAVQIFSTVNKVSPEGIGKYAHDLIKNYNKKVRVGKQISDITDQQLKSFTERARKLEGMKDGRPKDIETAKLIRDVEALTPSTWQEKGAMYLYLSQLLFPKTAIRNIVGNSFMLVAEDVSRLIGAPADAVATMITKRPRTIYAPHILRQMGDLYRGFKMGAEEAVQGIDLRNTAKGKYDVKPFVFKNKVGQIAEKTLAVELTAFDRAFYEAARNNVIRDMTRGLAKKQGIPVGKIKPTQEILDTADAFGKYMTYQDDSALAKLAIDFKHGLNRVTTKNEAFGAGSAVLNYPKTPSNLLLRGIDFSPAGYVRVLADIARPLMMRGEKFNRTKFINDASRATTGSIGLVGLGALFQTVGIVTPGNKDASKDVNAFQRSIGSGNYKFNVDGFKRYVFSGFNPDQAKPQQGDQLVSYDWAQPLAIPFTAGAEIAQQSSSVKQSTKKRIASLGNVGAQVAEGAQTLTEQPLLQGVQKLFSQQNGINGALSLAQTVPSSFVPASIRGVRNLTDNVPRETYSPNFAQSAYNKVANSIPGLSKTLPAQYTPLGEQAENYQNGTNSLFNVAFNPAFVSKYQTDEVQGEIQRLFAKTGSASVIPNLANTNYTVNGQNYTLDGKQKSEFQKTMGSTANVILGKLFQTDYYNSADDLARQKMIQNVITDATAVAKTKVIGVQDENMSKRAENILLGGMPDYSGRKAAAKAKTKTTKKVTSGGRSSAGSSRFVTTGFKTASSSKVPSVRGISVRKPSYKGSSKKLAVSKLPKISSRA